MSRLGTSLAALMIASLVAGSPLQAQEQDRTVLTVRLSETHRQAIEDAPGKLTWEMIGPELSQNLEVYIRPDQAWTGQGVTRSIRLVAVTLDREGQVVDRKESEPVEVSAEEAAEGMYRTRRPGNPFPGLNINVPSENYLPAEVYSPEAAFSPEALAQSVPEQLSAAIESRVGVMVYARFEGAPDVETMVRPLLVTVVPRPVSEGASMSRPSYPQR